MKRRPIISARERGQLKKAVCLYVCMYVWVYVHMDCIIAELVFSHSIIQSLLHTCLRFLLCLESIPKQAEEGR